MNQTAHIFLGANSGEGFYSLYDQLLNARFDDLIILKGCPGCGKSSFMRAVAETVAPTETDRIYVSCSGDPDSLDAVLFPQWKAGVVDGTAPHVLEPSYAIANERYVDLTQCCDVGRIKQAGKEVVAHTDAYRAAYAEAYRALRAVREIEEQRRGMARAAADAGKLERRMDGIARRELRGTSARRGRVDRAFLGGVTHKGELCRFDTVEALCPRVYRLEDDYGLASAYLERLCTVAADAGCDVLACQNPDRPREVEHLLIPARGVAFVTATADAPYSGEAYRTLRLNALPTAALTRAEKAKLRFLGRIERALRDEAVEALRRAKSEHDALEAAYHPFVDFAAVGALAKKEAERIETFQTMRTH